MIQIRTTDVTPDAQLDLLLRTLQQCKDYKFGADHPEYQPDFVAETEGAIYLLESKADSEMDNTKVVAKRDAAVKWCSQASAHAKTYDGKPWKYVLIPHDIVLENMTLEALAAICCLVTWTLPIVQRRRFDSFEHTQRKVPPSKGDCRLHGSPSAVKMPGNPPQPLPGGVYV